MLRFYLTPVESVPWGNFTMRRPLHVATAGIYWSATDYGLEPTMLVVAETDATQHAALLATGDVYGFPDNWDDTIPDAPAVRADLEPYGIPLAWITNGLAWRRVIRFVIFLFTVAQRLHGLGAGSIFPTGANFNTLWEELPSAYQAALVSAFEAFELPTDALSAGTTLRDILESIASATASRTFEYALVGEV